jgi:hypothetical protein
VTVIAVIFANASVSADAHSTWSYENQGGNLAFHKKHYSEAYKCFKRAQALTACKASYLASSSDHKIQKTKQMHRSFDMGQ